MSFTCRVCRRGGVARSTRAAFDDPICAKCWAENPHKRDVEVLDVEKKLPARTQTGTPTPEEVLDPTRFANDLTAVIGATARFAFTRSVRDNTGGIRSEAARYAEHIDEWPAFTREVFANLFDPDALVPLPQDEQSAFARAALHALELQPSYPTLRASASAHRVIAAESGSKLSAIVGRALGLDKMAPDDVQSTDPRRVQDTAEVIQEMMEEAGASQDQIDEAIEESNKEAIEANTHRASLLGNLEQAMRTREMGAMVAAVAGEAAQKAEAVALCRGFGLGASEDGDDGVDQELIDMVAGNPDLMKVLRECGRLRESAAAKGLAVTATGACDVVGIVPSDDPLRLVPSELALLDDEDFGDDVLKRLVDGEAQCWELEGKEYRDRGDIILIVDRSGSMAGATIVFARALAAASLVNARAQKRRVTLCMFGSGAPEVVNVVGNSGLKEALKALGLPASGGTDTPSALKACIDRGLGELRDPDVLIITDGGFPNNAQLRNQIVRYPGETRFNGLMLNGGGWGGTHADWLSESWDVNVDGSAGANETLVEIVRTVGAKHTDKRKE